MAPRPWHALIPPLLVVLVYAPVLGFGLVQPDQALLGPSALLAAPGGWQRAWLVDGEPVVGGPLPGWRPLAAMVLAAELRLGGGAPALHAVGLVLHALSAGLLAALARRLGAGRLAAAVGALVYALHPAQVEAVVRASTRPEQLATTLLLLGCLAAVHPVLRRWSPLPLLAAALCHEAALAGPALAGLCQLADPRRDGRVEGGGLPWLALSGWIGLRLAVGLPPLPALEGPGLLLPGLVEVALPVARPPLPLPGPAVPAGLTALVLLATAGLCAWPRVPALARAGLAWLLLALLAAATLGAPVMGWRASLLHPALAGLGLLAAGLVPRGPARLGALALPLGLGLLTLARLPPWQGDEALWRWAVARFPGHPAATLRLAEAVAGEGRREEACTLLGEARAAALRLGDGEVHVTSTTGLGDCALADGDAAAAADLYREASLAAGGASLPAELGLVQADLAAGRLYPALEAAGVLVQRWPEDARGWHLYGEILALLGSDAAALEALDRSLLLEPDHAAAAALREQVRRRITAR